MNAIRKELKEVAKVERITILARVEMHFLLRHCVSHYHRKKEKYPLPQSVLQFNTIWSFLITLTLSILVPQHLKYYLTMQNWSSIINAVRGFVQ
jgi:hypothetical protein